MMFILAYYFSIGGACPFSLHSSTIVLTNKWLMAHESSVFKASPRRQGGGGSPCLRSRLSPPRRRLGDKAVVDRLASPYRFKNIENKTNILSTEKKMELSDIQNWILCGNVQ